MAAAAVVVGVRHPVGQVEAEAREHTFIQRPHIFRPVPIQSTSAAEDLLLLSVNQLSTVVPVTRQMWVLFVRLVVVPVAVEAFLSAKSRLSRARLVGARAQKHLPATVEMA